MTQGVVPDGLAANSVSVGIAASALAYAVVITSCWVASRALSALDLVS